MDETRAWDEAMDGPAPAFPAPDMHLTDDQRADYRRAYWEHVERQADLRAAEQEADFEAWRKEMGQ